MLIGGDDISNYDLIILGMCFSMFVYIHTSFCFVLIGENLTAQSTGSHRGIGGGIIFKFWRHSCKLSFLFPPRHQSAPESLLAHYWTSLYSILFHKDTKNNLTNNIQPFWPHAWSHVWLIAQSIRPVRVERRRYTHTYFPGRSSQTISSKPITTWPSRTFFPRTKFAILCWAPLTPAENPTGKGAMPDTDKCGCITTCSNTCRKPSLMASTVSESSVVIAMFIDWSLPPVKNKALNFLRLKFPQKHDRFAVLLCPLLKK